MTSKGFKAAKNVLHKFLWAHKLPLTKVVHIALTYMCVCMGNSCYSVPTTQVSPPSSSASYACGFEANTAVSLYQAGNSMQSEPCQKSMSICGHCT